MQDLSGLPQPGEKVTFGFGRSSSIQRSNEVLGAQNHWGNSVGQFRKEGVVHLARVTPDCPQFSGDVLVYIHHCRDQVVGYPKGRIVRIKLRFTKVPGIDSGLLHLS